MKDTITYSISDICAILNIDVPPEYKSIAHDKLTKLTHRPALIVKDCGFFLLTTNPETTQQRVAEAIEKKVKIIFCNKANHNIVSQNDVPYIVVDNVRESMVSISAHMRSELGCTVVGVTGSLGKTTTKEMLHSVLKQTYKTTKSPGNANTAFNIFGNVQKIEKGTEIHVQEFGVGIENAPMSRNAKVCSPNAAVITCISDPHLDVFGTHENILNEKLDLVRAMPKGSPVFLNYDDELLQKVKSKDHTIISYAVNNKKADYYADKIEVFDDYMTFNIVHKKKSTPVTLFSHGTHNIGNALAAMAVGEWFNIPTNDIIKGLEEFRSEGIRQSLTNIGGYQLYVDCYNTAPVSLLGAIDVISRLKLPDENGKRIAVIGDIVRLGDQATELHKETGEKIGKSGKLDLVLCFGNEYAKLMADTIRENGTASLYTDNREELNMWMKGLITKKDIALVKGPVARLLGKSIDQVYGTSYHLNNEFFDRFEQDNYNIISVYEKEDPSKRLAALSKYMGHESSLKLPSAINAVEVFSVGPGCFMDNMEITNIEISEPTFNISKSAFRRCRNLIEIKLPSTLKAIGQAAFSGCSNLKEITLPEGTLHIDRGAFAWCKNLKKIVIPASVGFIGENAFKNTRNVTIICPKNSYAEQFAIDNKIKYNISM